MIDTVMEVLVLLDDVVTEMEVAVDDVAVSVVVVAEARAGKPTHAGKAFERLVQRLWRSGGRRLLFLLLFHRRVFTGSGVGPRIRPGIWPSIWPGIWT